MNRIRNYYFPYKEAIKPMAELGLFGAVIPEAYGGSGMGWLEAMIITEDALIGFRGRGFDDVVQPDFCHHLLPEALIFQGP
jgi:alkylation response protein AidB-like acyl-CoA dehydrogenase